METDLRKPGGRPTRDQAAALDRLVLDGARSVFGRKGVSAGTIEDIAAEIGVSKHTLYRRHPDKTALLDAVVARDIGHFRHALSSAAGEGAEPLDALRRVALRYVEIGSARDYAAFYLSINAEAAVSPALRAKLAGWSGTALEPLVAAVAAAQTAGRLRPGDACATCAVLVDLLEGVNNRVRLGDEAPGGASLLQRLFDERWAVFVAALGGRG